MANTVSTLFSVFGPNDEVERFLKIAIGNDHQNLFDNFIPMPKELLDVVITVSGKRNITDEESNKLTVKYGADNWYWFAYDNWGVKGYNEVGEWKSNKKDESGVNSYATVYYETSGAAATKLWLTVSKLFPKLLFYHEFDGGWGEWTAYQNILNGEVLSEKTIPYDTAEGIEMRKRLGTYYIPDENGDFVKWKA